MQPTHRGSAPTRRSRAGRRASAAIGAGLLAATSLAVLPAAPAGAVTVGDEAAIRAAFADATETVVTLTTNIDLVDCVEGDLERTSATPITVEANGFRLRQTCVGERILRLDGGGGITVDHIVLTGGSPVGSGGGAISSDGPVIVRNGTELSGNVAPNGGAIDAHGPGATITVLDSLVAVNASDANGGALFADAPVELRDSTFADNVSGSNGGVVTAGSVLISGSTFQGNRAEAAGVVQTAGSVTIESSSFTGNQATDTDGGVILLVDADATVTGSTFQQNDAAGNGGAIAAMEGGDGSAIALSDSTFTDNTAVEGGAVFGVGTATVSATRMEANASTALSGGAIFMTGALTVDQGSVLTGNASDQNGGAIAAAGPLTVADSEVTQNTATSVGGGIAAFQGLTVTGSTVVANAADQGGGIYSDGFVDIADSTVSSNVATIDEGGAIRTGGGAHLARSVLDSNGAAQTGGAIFAFDVPITIEASTLSNNAAGTQGGAVLTTDGATIDGSTFVGNESGRGGAIFSSGDLAITGTTFDSNGAFASDGGAVHSEGPTTLTGSTLVANVAPSGKGGAISAAQTVTVTNSTISGNEAGVVGGGIGSEADVRLVHVTLVENAAPSGANLAMVTPGSTFAPTATVLGLSATDDCRLVGVTVASGGYNRSADDSCALADLTDAADAGDPGLGELADNGGATATRLPVATSPLIDAIPEASCAALITTDQRAAARPAGSGCDIGAVEVGATPDGGGQVDTPDAADGADAVQVLGEMAVDGGTGAPGTLPATGSTYLLVLSAIGAALVAAGRLLVGLGRRRV